MRKYVQKISVAVWLGAVLKKWHGWLSGSALMGFVGFLQALKVWQHPSVKVYLGLLCVGFLVSFFQAWHDEYKVRLQVENTGRWDALQEKFKNLDDHGILIARWTVEIVTGNCIWEVNAGSAAASKLAVEMCREAGAQLLRSKSFVAKFGKIATVEDNGDRWLFAVREVGGFGKPAGTTRSLSNGRERNYERGQIDNVKEACQVICHMARNEFEQ